MSLCRNMELQKRNKDNDEMIFMENDSGMRDIP